MHYILNKPSVILSVHPKYCELIAAGEKTIEVRKSKPKLKTPFRCYIYCTKKFFKQGNGYFQGKYCGKIIGEFICDCIIPISITYSEPNSRIAQTDFPYTCLTDKEIMDYLGNGNQGYGWHISDLQIYDKPKELSSFYLNCDCNVDGVCDLPFYKHCGYENIDDNRPLRLCGNTLTRPPQSWCYVRGEYTHAR